MPLTDGKVMPGSIAGAAARRVYRAVCAAIAARCDAEENGFSGFARRSAHAGQRHEGCGCAPTTATERAAAAAQPIPARPSEVSGEPVASAARDEMSGARSRRAF